MTHGTRTDTTDAPRPRPDPPQPAALAAAGPVTADRLEDAVSAVTRVLVAEAPLGETLHRVAGLALQVVRPAVALGLSLHDDDTAGDAGPGLFAHSTGDVVLVEPVPVLRDRWPGLATAAADNGLH